MKKKLFGDSALYVYAHELEEALRGSFQPNAVKT